MSQLSLIITILGGIIAVILIVTYPSYRSDIRAARERVMSGSQVIETKCGHLLIGQEEKVRSEVVQFIKYN